MKPKLIAAFFCLLGWCSFSSSAASTNDTVYMFTSFRENGQDGLRFLYSFDALHWTNVPGTFMKPNVGGKILRDPSIVRGPDGTFHLVWTTAWRGDKGFGYASSTNLINWSEQKFVEAMKHEPDTANVWAPELFYDDAAREFVICWASTIPGRFPDHLEPRTNNHRMYYTTTTDFKTFTPTKLYLDPDFSVIDCQIVKRDTHDFVLLLKDNTRPQRDIRVAFGDGPLGPWRNISPPFTEKFTEGPCAMKVGEEWLIYFDVYQRNIYGAMKTRDFKTFTDITSEVSFPEHHKHGTAFRAPRALLNNLLKQARDAGNQ
ncbi:MAG TPA: glycoside hydrolase family 43 protein [Verrucomicrobiae bacterium]|nr:glycoside hydrolase family 43 protein [Verrucomicrobiae bacterium]